MRTITQSCRITPAMLLNLWANPPQFTPVVSVRNMVQDMGNAHSYPKNRRQPAIQAKKRTVYTPAKLADKARRIEKANAVRAAKYSFMRGKGWMTSRAIADVVCLDRESTRVPLLSLVDLGYLERKAINRLNVQYRWVGK